MKEFINKLIDRLEEEHEKCINRYGVVGGNLPASEVKQCMEIINQLAEEYNNGWIACLERLPEESGEYYTYVYYDGRYMYSIDEIDCDGIIKEWNCSSDYQIIAWKPIAPYQPKGE